MRQGKRIASVIKEYFLRIFHLCPVRWVITLLSVVVIAAFELLQENTALMYTLCETVVRPMHRSFALLWSHIPVSGAEVIIGIFAVCVLIYLGRQMVYLVRRRERLQRCFRILMTAAALTTMIYAGFCLLWGVYYAGDDFVHSCMLDDGPVSVEQLSAVTELFAEKVNTYGEQVCRNEEGYYRQDRSVILEKSAHIYDTVEKSYPYLSGLQIPVKGVFFSKVMSYTDFTGFFFPFTAEANVNMDFPPALLASTAAHELAHQRSVCREQDANFAAVLASLESGDPDYCYSASLLAYIHLSNALYRADHEEWKRISSTISENVRKDLDENNQYWKQFRTPVQTVSNKVYEGFLHSYDQNMGLQSYGACVNLLIHYYEKEAEVRTVVIVD